MRRVLIVALLCTVSVTAGWYSVGDTVSVDGHEYAIGYGLDRVEFRGANRSIVVDKGNCEQHGWHRFCFSAVEDEISDDRVSFVNGSMHEAVKISVNKQGPELSVSRRFGDRPLRVGEPVPVNVTVENSGSTGTKYTYTHRFPPDIYRSGGFEQAYTRDVGISPGVTQEFTYNVTPRDFVDTEDEANITYRHGGESRVATDTRQVRVAKPFNLSTSFTPSDASLNDTLVFNLSITTSRNVSIRAVLDANTRLMKGKQTYIRGVNGSTTVQNRYRARPGVNRVAANVSVDETYTRDVERTVNVSFTPLAVNVSVEEGVNEGRNVTVTTGWPERFNTTDATVSLFGRDNPVSNGTAVFTAPAVEQRVNRTATATVEYRAASYRFSAEDTAVVKVYPVPADLALDVQAPDTVVPGNTTVSAVVSNEAPTVTGANVSIAGRMFNVSVPAEGEERVDHTVSLEESRAVDVLVHTGDDMLRESVHVDVERREAESRERSGFIDGVVGFFTQIGIF